MLKKTLTTALLTGSILAGSAFSTVQAGIPVIDAGSIAQAVLQVNEAKKRYDTLRNQFKASTGNAGLGLLVNDPTVKKALNQYMPQGYGDLNKAISNGNIGALQGLLNNVKANEAQLKGKGKERLAATMLVNQAQLDGLLKTLDTRSNKVDGIVNQINGTTDLSSKADLANTLSGEQALINTEMNKMSILMKQMDMQQRLAEKQAVSESKQALMGSRP